MNKQTKKNPPMDHGDFQSMVKPENKIISIQDILWLEKKQINK